MTDQPDNKQKVKNYMQYSGMAVELIAILVFAVFLGKRLDAWLDFEKPYLTLILLLTFLIGYFMRIYYTLIK